MAGVELVFKFRYSRERQPFLVWCIFSEEDMTQNITFWLRFWEKEDKSPYGQLIGFFIS